MGPENLHQHTPTQRQDEYPPPPPPKPGYLPNWRDEMPPHAFMKSPSSSSLSSGVQGEWSDTTRSMSPSLRACHKRSYRGQQTTFYDENRIYWPQINIKFTYIMNEGLKGFKILNCLKNTLNFSNQWLSSLSFFFLLDGGVGGRGNKHITWWCCLIVSNSREAFEVCSSQDRFQYSGRGTLVMARLGVGLGLRLEHDTWGERGVGCALVMGGQQLKWVVP